MTKATDVRDNQHNVRQSSQLNLSLGHETAAAQLTRPRYTSLQPTNTTVINDLTYKQSLHPSKTTVKCSLS